MKRKVKRKRVGKGARNKAGSRKAAGGGFKGPKGRRGGTA